MPKTKKKTKNGTTTQTTGTTVNPVSASRGWTPGISGVRTNFDEVQKTVRTLPEGKIRTKIMDLVENAYLGVANALNGASTRPIEA